MRLQKVERHSCLFLIVFLLCNLGFAHQLPAQSMEEKAEQLSQELAMAESDSARVFLYLKLFRVSRFMDPVKRATQFKEALVVAERYGAPHPLGMIWFWKGESLKQAGDFPAFIKANEKASTYFKTAGTMEMVISCQVNIGSALVQMGQAEEGNQVLAEALEEAEASSDHQLLAIAQNNIAISFASNGDYEKAGVYFQQALATQLEAGDSVEVASAAGNLGTLNFRMGRHVKAIEFFVYAAEIDEILGNREGLAINFLNISQVYYESGDHASALEYGNESLGLFRELDNPGGMVLTIVGLAAVHKAEGRVEEAYQFYQEGVSISEAKGLRNENYGKCLQELGRYWKDKGNISKALNYLEDAEEVFLSSGNQANLPAVNILLAQIAYARKDYGLAAAKYKTVAKTTKQSGNLEARLEAHKGLSQVYEAWQKPGLALQEYKLAKEVSDTLLNAANREQVAEIQTRYDSKRRKRLLILEKERSENLRLENELIERKHQISIQIAVGGIAFLLIIIVFVAVWSRQKRRILSQEQALTMEKLRREEEQRSSLEALTARQASEIGERTRLMSEIRAELEEIKGKNVGSESVEFMHLFKVIELNIRSSEEWADFKQNFERLHPRFLGNLHAQFPALSPAETRLCVLVRLGMNKKDIANIINIHPDSVKRARNRLRNKLGLTPEVELKEFLKRV